MLLLPWLWGLPFPFRRHPERSEGPLYLLLRLRLPLSLSLSLSLLRNYSPAPARTNVGWIPRRIDETLMGEGRTPIEIARLAHLDAARHHLEAASKHLAVVARYNEDDLDGAEKHSADARVASQTADGKSIEAHRKATIAANTKIS